MITHLPQPINILKETPYQMPPWKLPHIKCCRELLHLNKHTMPESQLRTEFINHSQKHYAAIAIYTDGSKTNEHVAAAATSGNVFSVSRLMTFASIYTAELVAIIKALRYINLQYSTSFVIYSDSRSALEAITKNIPNHPLICEIQRWIVLLNSNNKAISLCWVPAHVRIEGNELADQLAREATNLHISNRAIPASDYIPIIKSTIYSQWQHKWEETPQSNKLRQIKETVKRWSVSSSQIRRWETVLTRLRIGHTRITHGHLMTNSREQPNCDTCHVPLTVPHILLSCTLYNNDRKQFFPSLTTSSLLNDILSDDSTITIDSLMGFLTKIKLINEI
ncbi:unnamed protein product [Rotaria socialis]|uniref:ribonuclease H n=1 Tax=Rotaria socialis TaxID=392032 RepID=A0A821WH52_9BILA|nr:unnamed protein product [Rotaria socialis]